MPAPTGPDAPEPTPPAGLELAPGVVVPDSAIEFSFTRSSGPGGQHVNKVATRCRLRLSLAALHGQLDEHATQRLITLAGARITKDGELVLTAGASRSQHANRKACMERLRGLIVSAQRQPKKRKRTRPSAASKQRRLEQKKRRARIKLDRKSPHSDA